MSAAGHAQYDITFARKTYHRDILPNQSVMIGALDDETTIGRCAAPSGRIWVISGSLTSSPVRLWTLATHMLTAGPTSLLIHALGSFTFRIRTVTQ